MHKRLIAACMALAAFAAFVLPATASATNDPTLTENGSDVTVGETLIGTNIGSANFVTTGDTAVAVGCSKLALTGTVVKNSGGTVEATISKVQFSGTGSVHPDNGLPECTASFGNTSVTFVNLPLCLRSDPTMLTDEFQIVSSDCEGSGTNIKILFSSTTAGECEYKFTSAVPGTETTGGSGATLTISNTQSSGYEKIKGGFLCPSSWQFKTAFNLYTDTESEPPLVIS